MNPSRRRVATHGVPIHARIVVWAMRRDRQDPGGFVLAVLFVELTSL